MTETKERKSVIRWTPGTIKVLDDIWARNHPAGAAMPANKREDEMTNCLLSKDSPPVHIEGWNLALNGDGLLKFMNDVFQEAITSSLRDLPPEAWFALDLRGEGDPLDIEIDLPAFGPDDEAPYWIVNLRSMVDLLLRNNDDPNTLRKMASSLRDLADLIEKHNPDS